MENALFQDVFGKMHLSANVKSNLKNSIVSNVKVWFQTKTMEIALQSDKFVDESCLEDLEKDIIESFPGVENVDASISYPMENLTPEEKIEKYWHKLSELVYKKSICCSPVFKKANWHIKDNSLIIEVANNTYKTFHILGIDNIIEKALKDRLKLEYRVKFVDRPFTKEEAEKFKKAQEIRVREYCKIVAETKENNEPATTSAPVVNDSKFKKRQKVGTAKTEEITEDIITIKEACTRSGNVAVEGKLYSETEITETRKGGYIVKNDLYDGTDCVPVKLFCSPEDFKENFKSLMKKGCYVKVKGNLDYDKYENNEQVLIINALNEGTPPEMKIDDAEEKRVELHLHTNMSMMDAINPAADYINRASKWGHKAIAITDHGVVQAFPEAMSAAKKAGIKVLYGCEGYMVNDIGAVVKIPKGQSLDSTFVVFDLETTGLNTNVDKIIEIGAVKVTNGEIVDRYSTFVNPQEHITEKISKLTGIYDDMVENAPTENEILPEFLDFIGDSVVVAHNAGFDTAFLKRYAKANSIIFDNTIIDTVELGKTLLPKLNNFKLDTICEAVGVSLENHHRAVDDAEATAECFIKFIDMLKDLGEETVDSLNELGAKNIDKSKIRKRYHIIIFAKNQAGVKNLYQLVSDAHIKYFGVRGGRPHFPKSEILKYRDNFILGSACEAGDLYEAVYNDLPDEDIKEIVDFYDYLEVQPLGNNQYMIGNTKKNGKTVNGWEDLERLNKRIIDLGDKYNKPVVATGDVHFIDPEYADFRKIVQVGEGYKVEDVENQPPLYFRTTKEMLDEFKYIPPEKAYEIVVTNTNLVADMIDDDIYAVPNRKCPPVIEGADDELREITTNKAKSIYGDPLPPNIEDRLNRELESIIGNGYAVLYIIAQKLVWDSNAHGYIVGSRGSVGSSFAATMAGITEVNPLDPHYVCPNCKYSDFTSEEVKKVAGNSGFDLPDRKCPHCGADMNKDGQAIPFETFLGFNGDKEPDIDLNFSGEDQTRAHRYCEELFGEGHVFKAGTIATLQDKTVFGYVLKYCEAKGINMKGAKKRWLVNGCVGVKRSTGQHPGGLVVVPDYTDIYEFCPVQHPANKAESGVKTTHFDYHKIDSCLLKLDMLGHDVPTILRMFHDITGFDPLKVPMNDKETMSLFTSPDALGLKPDDINGCPTGSLGLPEFGTPFVIGMLVETQPQSFSGLVKISGLSHGTDVWNGNAQELIANGTCTLNEVIPTRDDIMVYLQLHGLPNKDAFSIMEHVRKGKGLTGDEEALMREHNVPDWYIGSCKKIKYMFPKGHAVAYCTNTFRIGYFKINYPEAFYAATFSVKYDDFDYQIMCFGENKARETYSSIMAMGKEASAKDKTTADMLKLVIELYARGIKFAPIDLYESGTTKFKVIDKDDGKYILPPFCTISGFGVTAAESLVNARDDGTFETIEELQKRTGLGQSNIQMLKDAGVLGNMRETDQLTLFV